VADGLQAGSHRTFSALPRADRYGWRLQGATLTLDESEIKLQKAESVIELRREGKWAKILGKFEDFKKRHPQKFQRWILKGIPDCLRLRVWQLILDPDWDKDMGNRASVESLVEKGNHPSCRTIAVDLRRTLPKMVMFSDSGYLDSLRNVLHAYTNVDPQLGYVQGMAFPAAMLLSYLHEECAFWCFFRLMCGSKIQFRRLYVDAFSGLQELSRVWEMVLADSFPNVAANFEANHLLPAMYTTSWFLTAFMNSEYPPDLRVRLFDRFVAFGCRALLSFAKVIVALNQEELAVAKTNQCFAVLQKPEILPTMKDWRVVIEKYDAVWMSEKEYEKAFAKANVKLFY
jgi:hypothetical protein